MSKVLLRLSVEELAFAFIRIGKQEMADELIAARYSSLGKEDFATRLVTIYNSMLARGWFKNNILDPKVEKIVKSLADAKHVIWCSRNSINKVDNVSYHFGEDIILENRLEQDVVHRITALDNLEAVLKSSATFFEMNRTRSFSCPPALIPDTALRELLDVKENVPILKRLEDPDFTMIRSLKPQEKVKQIKDPKFEREIPRNTRRLFAADWESARDWGVVMRIEYGETTIPQFDRGFIILRGGKRSWLMRPKMRGGEQMMEVFPGIKEAFLNEMKALV